MKTLIFIAITLLSGAIAGTVVGLINQVIVEPLIDKAITIETQREVAASKAVDDPSKQSQYRIWQKEGEIVAAAVLGTSISSLFGIVFGYSRESLPGSNNIKKSLVLAGIMFFVLYLVPALKYPANPPAVGSPDTIYYREILYIGFIVVSGITALALALVYRILDKNDSTHQFKKRIRIPLIYAMVIIGAYIVFPYNPDEISIPMKLVVDFRVASALTIGIFWGLMAIILGSFWDHLQPFKIINGSDTERFKK